MFITHKRSPYRADGLLRRMTQALYLAFRPAPLTVWAMALILCPAPVQADRPSASSDPLSEPLVWLDENGQPLTLASLGTTTVSQVVQRTLGLSNPNLEKVTFPRGTSVTLQSGPAGVFTGQFLVTNVDELSTESQAFRVTFSPRTAGFVAGELGINHPAVPPVSVEGLGVANLASGPLLILEGLPEDPGAPLSLDPVISGSPPIHGVLCRNGGDSPLVFGSPNPVTFQGGDAAAFVSLLTVQSLEPGQSAHLLFGVREGFAGNLSTTVTVVSNHGGEPTRSFVIEASQFEPIAKGAVPLQSYGLNTRESADRSADGRFLAVAAESGAALLDGTTLELLRVVGADLAPVDHVRFLDDGRLFVSGRSSGIYDVLAGVLDQEAHPPGFHSSVNVPVRVRISPDGQQLVAASEWSVSSFDLGSSTPLWSLADVGPVLELTVSPDSSAVAVLTTEGVRLLDLDSGGLKLFSPGSWTDVAFDGTGERLLLPDGLVMWTHGAPANALHPSSNSRSVRASRSGSYVHFVGTDLHECYRLDTGEKIFEVSKDLDLQPRFLLPLGQARSVCAWTDGEVSLYNQFGLLELSLPESFAFQSGFLTDQVYYALDQFGNTHLFQANTGKLIGLLDNPFPLGSGFGVVNVVGASPDGSHFVLAEEGDANQIAFCRFTNGNVVVLDQIQGNDAVVRFSQDGQVCVVGYLKSHQVEFLRFQFASGQSDEFSLVGGVEDVLAASDGGRYALSVTGRLWDVDQNQIRWVGSAAAYVVLRFNGDELELLENRGTAWHRVVRSLPFGTVLQDDSTSLPLGSLTAVRRGPFVADSSGSIYSVDTGLRVSGWTTDVPTEVALPSLCRYMVGLTAYELLPARAVIVAGGGNYAGNAIARQTDDLGAYAYRALRARGYSAENIAYLSAFGPRDADGDGLSDVDGNPDLATTSETLRGSFSRESGRLLVLMLDHGYRTDSFMGFRSTPNTVLSSARLRSWLDELQTGAPVDVTVVVDSCYSGQLAEDLLTTATGALPPGRLRTAVASTGTTGVAVFVPPPDLTSFMQTWLASAYMGSSVGSAFQAGSDLFAQFPVAGQTPLVRASDGADAQGQAQQEFLGASWAYGVQAVGDADLNYPVFDTVVPPTVVTSGQSTRLWVRTLSGVDPDSVVATLRPPAPEVLTGDPVTTLPTFLLTALPDGREWELQVPGPSLLTQGVYRVTFTARFSSGRVSRPGSSSITVSDGPDPDQTVIRAVLAVGDSSVPQTQAGLQALAQQMATTYVTRFQDNQGQFQPQWISLYGPWNTTELLPTGATASGLLSAIFPGTDLSCGRLYVHLAGESGGPGALMLGTGEVVYGVDLDAALDALQARQNCDVVLVVDTPQAGHFATVCRATPGQRRAVLVSGRNTDPALYLANPPVSYSGRLLSAALQGSSLFDSHQSARLFFAGFLQAQGGQAPQPILDDDGDGAMTFADGAMTRGLYLGRRYAIADDSASGLPFVLGASLPQIHPPGSQSDPFTAFLVEGVEPLRVFAVVVPPGFNGQAVNDLPQVNLTRVSPLLWDWSAPLSVPTQAGDYTVAIYAEYPDGAGIRISAPAFTQLSAAPNPTEPDSYEGEPVWDSTSASLLRALPGESQIHTLHTATDEDWLVLGLPGLDAAGSPVFVPFTLDFSDLLLPGGARLQVEVTPLDPPGLTQTYVIHAGGSVAVPVPATGPSATQVRILGLDVSEVSGARYRLTLADPRGGNSGLISQIGSKRSNIGWTAPPGAPQDNVSRRFSGTNTAWRVYRTGSLPASARTLVGNRDWPAALGCPSGIPLALAATAAPGDQYFEVWDDYTGPVTAQGFAFLRYEVVPVTGTVEGAPIFTSNAVLNTGLGSGFATPYCAVSVPVGLTGFSLE